MHLGHPAANDKLQTGRGFVTDVKRQKSKADMKVPESDFVYAFSPETKFPVFSRQGDETAKGAFYNDREIISHACALCSLNSDSTV